ncbi:hypothetical protein B0H11DRAFT_2262012 [Mycena galericulata]|nr:hypothetical protein B0H11DRAFT_2262012 [Mycena galericulata]
MNGLMIFTDRELKATDRYIAVAAVRITVPIFICLLVFAALPVFNDRFSEAGRSPKKTDGHIIALCYASAMLALLSTSTAAVNTGGKGPRTSKRPADAVKPRHDEAGGESRPRDEPELSWLDGRHRALIRLTDCRPHAAAPSCPPRARPAPRLAAPAWTPPCFVHVAFVGLSPHPHIAFVALQAHPRVAFVDPLPHPLIASARTLTHAYVAAVQQRGRPYVTFVQEISHPRMAFVAPQPHPDVAFVNPSPHPRVAFVDPLPHPLIASARTLTHAYVAAVRLRGRPYVTFVKEISHPCTAFVAPQPHPDVAFVNPSPHPHIAFVALQAHPRVAFVDPLPHPLVALTRTLTHAYVAAFRLRGRPYVSFVKEIPQPHTAFVAPQPHPDVAFVNPPPHPRVAFVGPLHHPLVASARILPHAYVASVGLRGRRYVTFVKETPHPHTAFVVPQPHQDVAFVNPSPHPHIAFVGPLPHPDVAFVGVLTHPHVAFVALQPHPHVAIVGRPAHPHVALPGIQPLSLRQPAPPLSPQTPAGGPIPPFLCQPRPPRACPQPGHVPIKPPLHLLSAALAGPLPAAPLRILRAADLDLSAGESWGAPEAPERLIAENAKGVETPRGVGGRRRRVEDVRDSGVVGSRHVVVVVVVAVQERKAVRRPTAAFYTPLRTSPTASRESAALQNNSNDRPNERGVQLPSPLALPPPSATALRSPASVSRPPYIQTRRGYISAPPPPSTSIPRPSGAQTRRGQSPTRVRTLHLHLAPAPSPNERGYNSRPRSLSRLRLPRVQASGGITPTAVRSPASVSRPPHIQTRWGYIPAPPPPSTSIPRRGQSPTQVRTLHLHLARPPGVRASGGYNSCPSRSPASLYLHLRVQTSGGGYNSRPCSLSRLPPLPPRARPESERAGGRTPTAARSPASVSRPPRVRTIGGGVHPHPPFAPPPPSTSVLRPPHVRMSGGWKFLYRTPASVHLHLARAPSPNEPGCNAHPCSLPRLPSRACPASERAGGITPTPVRSPASASRPPRSRARPALAASPTRVRTSASRPPRVRTREGASPPPIRSPASLHFRLAPTPRPNERGVGIPCPHPHLRLPPSHARPESERAGGVTPTPSKRARGITAAAVRSPTSISCPPRVRTSRGSNSRPAHSPASLYLHLAAAPSPNERGVYLPPPPRARPVSIFVGGASPTLVRSPSSLHLHFRPPRVRMSRPPFVPHLHLAPDRL